MVLFPSTTLQPCVRRLYMIIKGTTADADGQDDVLSYIALAQPSTIHCLMTSDVFEDDLEGSKTNL